MTTKEKTRLLCIEARNRECRPLENNLKAVAPGRFEVACTPTLAEALALLEKETFAAATIDILLLAGGNAGEIARIKEKHPRLPVFVLAEQMPDDALAVNAFAQGAENILLNGLVGASALIGALDGMNR